jgi:hypothetical protein
MVDPGEGVRGASSNGNPHGSEVALLLCPCLADGIWRRAVTERRSMPCGRNTSSAGFPVRPLSHVSALPAVSIQISRSAMSWLGRKPSNTITGYWKTKTLRFASTTGACSSLIDERDRVSGSSRPRHRAPAERAPGSRRRLDARRPEFAAPVPGNPLDRARHR